jgi:hypothetical protein
MTREPCGQEARQHRLAATRNNVGQNVSRQVGLINPLQIAMQGVLVSSEVHHFDPFLRLQLRQAGCISWTFVFRHFTQATM